MTQRHTEHKRRKDSSEKKENNEKRNSRDKNRFVVEERMGGDMKERKRMCTECTISSRERKICRKREGDENGAKG